MAKGRVEKLNVFQGGSEMGRGNSFIVAVLLLGGAAASGAEVRSWGDNTGKFTLQASLIELRGAEILLKKADDGSHVTVPVFRMCDNCIGWLRENAQPNPLLFPPIKVDLTALRANEDQRVDLNHMLPGVSDFSIVDVAIAGVPDAELNRTVLRQPDDRPLTATLFPGGMIEIVRGDDQQPNTLLIRPLLQVERNVNITLSREGVTQLFATLQDLIANNQRQLRAVQKELEVLGIEIDRIQRALKKERRPEVIVRLRAQLHKLNMTLQAAQTRGLAIQKRLGDMLERQKRCATALEWLTQFGDNVAVTFRIECDVARRWQLPVAATWTAEDQQELGTLVDIAAEWRPLAHQWRRQNVTPEDVQQFLAQLQRQIGAEDVTVRFRITDQAADANGQPLLAVSPVRRLAGVHYPPMIPPGFVVGQKPVNIGDLVEIYGVGSLQHEPPAGARFRGIGEAQQPPDSLLLRFDLPSLRGKAWAMWLEITPAPK